MIFFIMVLVSLVMALLLPLPQFSWLPPMWNIFRPDNEPEPPLLPIDPVEIIPFPIFDNLKPLMLEEVQVEDLIDYFDGPGMEPQPAQLDNQQVQYDNLQIGLAHFIQPDADPVFSSWAPQYKPSPEAIRQWVRYFSQGTSSMPSVTIPDAWMNFFILLLLQSPSFAWTKDFLQSLAWDYFTASSKGNSSVFYLPNKCPNVILPVCTSSESSSVVIEELPSNVHVAVDVPSSSKQAPKTPKAKKGKAPILSKFEVRCSLRIKKLHKGFKNSSCKDMNCLGCNSSPPEISPSIIRDLGAFFYNINPELTHAKLHAKPASKKPVAKKNARKKPSSSSKKNGAQ